MKHDEIYYLGNLACQRHQLSLGESLILGGITRNERVIAPGEVTDSIRLGGVIAATLFLEQIETTIIVEPASLRTSDVASAKIKDQGFLQSVRDFLCKHCLFGLLSFRYI